jgi:UDP-GlcNAc:undecaprenyl-phosphate GlcNAc-1-phosphate transferase
VTGVAASAFAVSLVATGAALRAAARAGRLDVPSERSSHAHPVPRTGGFGVAAGFAAGGVVALAQGRPFEASVVTGALLFFAVGAWDDLAGLRAREKALLQVVAASVAALLGLRFHGAAFGVWPALGVGGALAGVAAVLLVFATVNVVNFLDGIDGIASATALVTLAAAAGASRGDGAGLASLAGAAAVVGFAPWNAPPAKTFLGDGGSHLLGFLVAAAACGPPPAGEGAPWPLVGAALVPAALDVAGGLVTKARRGVPLARAHNDHRYQRLVRAGRGHASVALRYATMALALVVAAGPLADRLGPAVALGVAGIAVLLHVAVAARETAGIPRLRP